MIQVIRVCLILSCGVFFAAQPAWGQGDWRVGRLDRVTVAPDAEQVQVISDMQGFADIHVPRDALGDPRANLVRVINLPTGDEGYVLFHDEAEVSCRLFAPAGSTLQINSAIVDPDDLAPDVLQLLTREGGLYINEFPPEQGEMMAGRFRGEPSSSPAVLLPVGMDPPEPGCGFPFVAKAGPELWAFGRFCGFHSDVHSGMTMTLTLDLRVTTTTQPLPEILEEPVFFAFSLFCLFDQEGRQRPVARLSASHVLTPTKMPIETMGEVAVDPAIPGGNTWSYGSAARNVDWRLTEHTDWSFEDGTAHIQEIFELDVPTDLEPGYYGLMAPPINLETEPFDVGDSAGPGSLIFLFRLGMPAQPHLTCVLLGSNGEGGSRGVVSLQDRHHFALNPRNASMPDQVVIPPNDVYTQEPWPYALDPYMPLLSLTDRPAGNVIPAPLIPLDLQSASCRVLVEKNGIPIDTLGPAPFHHLQNDMSVLRPDWVHPGRIIPPVSPTYGNPSLCDMLHLSGDGDFDIAFHETGRYLITLMGEIHDVLGHRYTIDGQFPVMVSRALDVEIFPELGTPLEPDSPFWPQVRVFPPMRAQVECVWTHYPDSDPARMVQQIKSGTTNRFGVFIAGGQPIEFDDPGEYVCDVFVSGQDDAGGAWAACRKGASVVMTPNSSIRIHGERGNRADRQQWRARWFLAGDGRFVSPGGVPEKRGFEGIDLGHTCYPYESSDVAWLGHDIAFSLFPNATFEDPKGLFADALEERWPGVRQGEGREGIYPRHLLPEDRRAIGELPFVNMTQSGLSPSIAPDDIDWHGYFYTTSWRPGVSVRAQVSEDMLPAGYWFFDDPYGYQLGNGPAGDLPGDVKMNYVGSVLRDDRRGITHYGGYASMLVLIDESDPLGPRVMPPFDGLIPGSPPGGPLVTLNGKTYQVFITFGPLAPGAILTHGDPLNLGGVVWPPVSGTVTGRIVAPDGSDQSFSASANAMGMFHVQGPSADRIGVYTIEIEAVCSGDTSLGRISDLVPQAQWPRGSGIGLQENRFQVPVLSRGAELISFDLPEGALADISNPLVIQGHLPQDAQASEVRILVSMPGQVIDQQDVSVTDQTFSYVYDPGVLKQGFPNLDTIIGVPSRFGDDVPAWFDSVLLTAWADSGETVTAGHVLLQGETIYPFKSSGRTPPEANGRNGWATKSADTKANAPFPGQKQNRSPRASRHTSLLALDEQERLLFAAHPYAREVVAIDVSGDRLQVRNRCHIQGRIESICFDGHGDLVLAVSGIPGHSSAAAKSPFGMQPAVERPTFSRILTLSRDQLTSIREFSFPGRIRAAIPSRDGELMLASHFDHHRVLVIDARTGAISSTEGVNRPSALAADDETGRLFAVSYRSGEMLAFDEDGTLAKRWPAVSQLNQSRTLTLADDGSVWTPATRSDTTVGGLTFDRSVFPVVARTRWQDDQVELTVFPDLLVVPPHRPVEVAVDGTTLYMASSGSDDVLAVDLNTGFALWHNREVGMEPGALALHRDERKLYALTLTGQELVELDADDGAELDRLQIVVDPTPSVLARGRYLFGNATDPRITKDQWMSCASCHPEGDADGRQWDFGAGPLDTSSLAGCLKTRPLHVTAHLDEIQDTYKFIRVVFAGQFFVDHEVMAPYLESTNQGLDEDLDALSAYIESLEAWVPPPVPEDLEDDYARGKALFFNEETRCAGCHPPPYYTDSGTRLADGSYLKHDVGTRLPEEGQRHQALDTPTLLGLAMRDPYLHDGRAATLESVFEDWNPQDQHGHTSHLSEEEIDDLVVFLLYLR